MDKFIQHVFASLQNKTQEIIQQDSRKDNCHTKSSLLLKFNGPFSWTSHSHSDDHEVCSLRSDQHYVTLFPLSLIYVMCPSEYLEIILISSQTVCCWPVGYGIISCSLPSLPSKTGLKVTERRVTATAIPPPPGPSSRRTADRGVISHMS